MPMTTYASPGVLPRTLIYAERVMLKHAIAIEVLALTALHKEMPKNESDTIKFRRPRPFDAATIPLQEGVTPTPRTLAYDDVSATLAQYGEVIEITDKISDMHEDPVVQNASMLCGENIARTLEQIRYGIVRGGTNVFYANGTQRTDVNTPISLPKQRAVTRALRAQKAMKITRMLAPSTAYGTSSVEGAYIAIGHTDLDSDIRNLPGFKTLADYGVRTPYSEYEIGSVEDVRYILSADLLPFPDAGGTKAGSGVTMVSTSGTSADVYPIMYFGQDSWGEVALRGQGAIAPRIIPVNSIDKSDPLGQRGYIGWKTWFTAVILNQLWMARLEVAATLL